MPSQDDELSTVGSPTVVAYPDVNSSKEARTIGRLKLALVAVSFGLLVMTVLFVWQIARKGNSSKKDQNVDLLNNQEYLSFKSSPCPIMMAKTEPPLRLPDQVQRYLVQASYILNSFHGIEGLAAMAGNVVYRDRVVWSHNYGVKDKKRQDDAPNQDTVFRVASVSKIFTVLFVFKLMESGRINCLDDPLELYEPRFQVQNPFNQQKITIRTYVLQELKNTELKSPPGKLPHYSNLGYALISRVLAEKFAGNDYEGWVQRNILIPLGMRNTGFNLDRMSSNKALGYFDNREAPMVDWDWAAPAIQAYSTVNDLYKLMTMLFDAAPTRILGRELIQQLMKPDFMYPDGKTVFGTGWEITDVGTFSIITKTGFIPGYSAGFAFVPEFKLGAIVLVSGREFGGQAAHSIVKTLSEVMDAVLLRQQLQVETVPDKQKYLGEYVIVSRWIPEVIVNITENDGLLLFTQTPGSLGWSYLKPVKEREFKVIYRPGLQCGVYGLGQDRERVTFDPPATSGKSLGLKFGPYIFKRTLPKTVIPTQSSNMDLPPSGLL
ncbi:putative beta-lactamase-like 1 isoform X2 [Montipora capricornis]|uniref:putative beta-lactamase-like 1 isoform X2 n=1 Tax=Montipora capricornis TaxID=246305 RepID=UPI0035F1B4A3